MPTQDMAKPRWSQFSIRGMLFVTSAVALACLAIGRHHWAKCRERAAVATIIDSQGSVRFDYQCIQGAAPAGPACLRRVLGDDYFSAVTQVRVTDPDEDGHHLNLQCLEAIPAVIALDMRGTHYPDDALAHLTRLPRLERLDLSRSRPFAASHVYTNSAIEQIKTCTRLRKLDIAVNQISGDGLRHLGSMADLEWLHASNNPIGDDGLQHLAKATQLRELFLFGTDISDDGLIWLSGLTRLERLSIGHTRVTDAGLVHLEGLTSLTFLDIACRDVTDAGMVHLESMSELRTLVLGNGVSGSRAAEVRKKLPKLVEIR